MFQNLLLVLAGGAVLAPAQSPPTSTTSMKMEGGSAVQDPNMFPDLVKINKKKDAADMEGETMCLGTIFSSVIIFTSMHCAVTDADKEMWMIEPINKAAVKISMVADGRNKNDFKRIDLVLPGLIMTDDGVGPAAAPFNMNPDDDMEALVTVFAFGEPMKACTVHVMIEDPAECQKLYAAAVSAYPNAELPKDYVDSVKCGVKGEETMNLTVKQGEQMKKMEVLGGTPCDDSLGSPVYAFRMVFGVVIKAFCGDPKLVMIQPSTKGLSLESYTEQTIVTSDDNGTKTEGSETDEPDPDERVTGTESSPRPSKTNNPERQFNTSRSLFNYVQFLAAAALCGVLGLL